MTLNVGYGFKGLLDTAGKADLIARVPNLPLARLAAHAASPFLPLPYLRATATQLDVAWNGWPAYLMGQLSMTGWWYYFLVALAVKETIPCLLLLAAGLIAFPWKRAGLEERLLLLPPLLFFVCFSLGKVQIGIRYVLPAFPFLFIFASSLARLASRRARVLIVLLLAAHAAAAVRACPDFIAYFNAIAGGPARGYRWLADSNLDWGQDLPALGRWIAANHVADPVYLVYFGTAEPQFYGVRYRNAPVGYFARPELSPADMESARGYLAISVNSYNGFFFTPDTRDFWRRWLATHQATQVGILAVFMTIVAGMGGNAATQTLTVIVRGIALGELTWSNARKALLKELLVGVANGIATGILVELHRERRQVSAGGASAGDPVARLRRRLG